MYVWYFIAMCRIRESLSRMQTARYWSSRDFRRIALWWVGDGKFSSRDAHSSASSLDLLHFDCSSRELCLISPRLPSSADIPHVQVFRSPDYRLPRNNIVSLASGNIQFFFLLNSSNFDHFIREKFMIFIILLGICYLFYANIELYMQYGLVDLEMKHLRLTITVRIWSIY